MPDKILVKGLKVFGHHGANPSEREQGQHFVVDLELALDLGEAGRTDRLEATVSYSPLIKQVGRIVSGEPCFLLEALAERIASAVLEYPQVDRVLVRVTKPAPPMAVHLEGVAVEIERSR
ncbi:MAG: dihydroneopterin aldolase [Actinomycetota bacterium]